LLKKKWKHYIKFEYTAPNTPQQNGKIERKFATLYGKIRSILNAAGFPAFLHSRLWSYAAKSVTQLENTIVGSSTMTASENFTGSNPNGLETYVLLVRLALHITIKRLKAI
jgi:transposase InsO family protein